MIVVRVTPGWSTSVVRSSARPAGPSGRGVDATGGGGVGDSASAGRTAAVVAAVAATTTPMNVVRVLFDVTNVTLDDRGSNEKT
jgi:hypothetical protein